MLQTTITRQQLDALIVVLQRAPVTQPEAVLMSEIINALNAALPAQVVDTTAEG